jgi:hypothetical protein
MIARWNRPPASGIASSVDTFRPAPDSPKMVTVADPRTIDRYDLSKEETGSQ